MTSHYSHLESSACPTCVFSPEGVCLAVVDWRAALHNAGPFAPRKEQKAILAQAPDCLKMHGTSEDHADYAWLAHTLGCATPS